LRLTNDPNRSTSYYSARSLFNGTDLAKVAYGDNRAVGEVTVEQIQKLHQKVLDLLRRKHRHIMIYFG